MNCTGESTRIQLESIEDLQYVLDNIYQYLIQEMPSQKENVEELMQKLTKKLAYNVDISGIPYHRILDAPIHQTYDPLDSKREQLLLSYLESYESTLKEYLEIRRQMPQSIMQAFMEKCQNEQQSDAKEWLDKHETELQNSLQLFRDNFSATFENRNNQSIANKEYFENGITELRSGLSTLKDMEKSLPVLIAKLQRAKAVLKEEAELATIKKQKAEEAGDITLSLVAIQRRLQELQEINEQEEDLAQEMEYDVTEDKENLSGQPVTSKKNTKKLNRRKSLLEREVEMKEHIQRIHTFLDFLGPISTVPIR